MASKVYPYTEQKIFQAIMEKLGADGCSTIVLGQIIEKYNIPYSSATPALKRLAQKGVIRFLNKPRCIKKDLPITVEVIGDMDDYLTEKYLGNYCRMCGARLHSVKSYCDDNCRAEFHRDQDENRKPSPEELAKNKKRLRIIFQVDEFNYRICS